MSDLNSQVEGPLPIAAGDLEALRLRIRRHMPTVGLGAHLRRKHGQSLEFRDYRTYVPGDDVRRIDWRASLRRGLAHEYLIRAYEAEEQMTVAVAIDVRPSMYLPVGHEKILVACWIARALATMVRHGRNRLAAHALFGGQAPLKVRGPEIEPRVHRFVKDLALGHPQGDAEWHANPSLDIHALLRDLPAASAVVVVSDLYFGDIDGFRSLLREAQRSYRLVVMAILDSWPFEAALLSSGAVRLEGLEGVTPQEDLVEPESEALLAIGERIRAHRAAILDGAQAGGLVSGVWQWPDSATDDAAAVGRWFRRAFLAFDPFESLFGGVR